LKDDPSNFNEWLARFRETCEAKKIWYILDETSCSRKELYKINSLSTLPVKVEGTDAAKQLIVKENEKLEEAQDEYSEDVN
jgi:hypothetical protein